MKASSVRQLGVSGTRSGEAIKHLASEGLVELVPSLAEQLAKRFDPLKATSRTC